MWANPLLFSLWLIATTIWLLLVYNYNDSIIWLWYFCWLVLAPVWVIYSSKYNLLAGLLSLMKLNLDSFSFSLIISMLLAYNYVLMGMCFGICMDIQWSYDPLDTPLCDLYVGKVFSCWYLIKTATYMLVQVVGDAFLRLVTAVVFQEFTWLAWEWLLDPK
jgi:hypothetical protein